MILREIRIVDETLTENATLTGILNSLWRTSLADDLRDQYFMEYTCPLSQYINSRPSWDNITLLGGRKNVPMIMKVAIRWSHLNSDISRPPGRPFLPICALICFYRVQSKSKFHFYVFFYSLSCRERRIQIDLKLGSMSKNIALGGHISKTC